jgi:hypothetical protein
MGDLLIRHVNVLGLGFYPRTTPHLLYCYQDSFQFRRDLFQTLLRLNGGGHERRQRLVTLQEGWRRTVVLTNKTVFYFKPN